MRSVGADDSAVSADFCQPPAALTLLGLKALPGNLTPPFKPDHYMYATAEPDYRTRSVELVAVRVAADSKVAVTTSAGVPSTPCLPKHGAPPPPTNGACHNVTLDKCGDGPGVPNPTEVVVEVAAAAGGTETYRVAIGCTLGPPTVSMLSFWPGVLSPKFSPSIQNYTLSLPNSSVSAVRATQRHCHCRSPPLPRVERLGGLHMTVSGPRV